MNDAELPDCPLCGDPAQTYLHWDKTITNQWNAACSYCPLTLGPFATRDLAIGVWMLIVEYIQLMGDTTNE